MDFRVLGSVAIADGERLLPIGGGQPRRLLGMLLAYRNTVVASDRLVDILWTDAPDGATATLQSYVSKLRRFVEMCGDEAQLTSRPPGYVLDLPDDLIDAGRFERDLTGARAAADGDPRRALQLVETALGEWRGAAFAEFADAEWVRPVAIRLEELRVTAEETRADLLLRLGRDEDVIGRLEALVVVHPFRERLWMQLLLGLYRSGRQPEALRYAQTFRAHMRDELGLEPSVAMRELETAILNEHPELDWTPPPPAPAPPERGGHRRDPSSVIPGEATPLIGRDGDLEIAARLFEAGRILTLFGPGGVGKTRLAYRLAATSAERFAAGIRLVELAPLRDAAAVVAAVADALDVQCQPNRSLEDSIVEVLADQQMLLVIDNCEHVLDGASELVETVVKWCPNLRVLATSREPLGIPAEVVWSVPPLPVPARGGDADRRALDENPAVRLFVERARAARPDFELDDAGVIDVVEICIALDGVPLAIELAAARMRSMSPAQLAARLPERFRVLEGARRATEARHRTLRDLVRWSYDLLTPAEQRLFERISLFADRFSLERAERTCSGHGISTGDIAPLLGALVDKSMLVAHADANGTRYRVLETLRQFGREELERRPECADVRTRHRAAHVELAEAAGAGLFGPEEACWGLELDDAFDDVREAHAAALAAGDIDAALRLVVAIREYAWRRIRYEFLTWVDATLADPAAYEHPLGPVAVGIAAYGRFVRGELDETITMSEEAVALANRLGASTFAMAERAAGNATFYYHRDAEALDWIERMHAVADAMAIPGVLAHACYMSSVAETSVGNHERGTEFAARATAAADASGNPTAHAQAAYAHALLVEHTHPARALRLLDESVRHADAVDNRWIRAFALTESLWIRAGLGEPHEALRGYRQVVATWFRGSDWANKWLSLRYVFAIFEMLGSVHAAATLFGALDDAGVMQALPVEPENADVFAHAVERVSARLGRHAFAECADRGRRLRDDEVVRFALDEIDRLTAPASG